MIIYSLVVRMLTGEERVLKVLDSEEKATEMLKRCTEFINDGNPDPAKFLVGDFGMYRVDQIAILEVRGELRTMRTELGLMGSLVEEDEKDD